MQVSGTSGRSGPLDRDLRDPGRWGPMGTHVSQIALHSYSNVHARRRCQLNLSPENWWIIVFSPGPVMLSSPYSNLLQVRCCHGSHLLDLLLILRLLDCDLCENDDMDACVRSVVVCFRKGLFNSASFVWSAGLPR
jgi:hypothetical protein